MADEDILDTPSDNETVEQVPAQSDPTELSQTGPGNAINSQIDDDALMGVNVDIVAVLGTAELQIRQILQLGRGAVVELDHLVGEPVELRAENRLVARGEVVVTDDKLAVQITDVVKSRF